MSDNLVELVPHSETQPDPETIAELENLLEQEKSGVVQGFAISIVCSDGSSGTYFTQSLKDRLFATIGSVCYLKQRLMAALDDE